MNRERAVRQAMLELSGAPFEYGRVDCVKFTGRVTELITGTDYTRAFAWSSEEEAYGIIRRHGSLIRAIESVLGDAQSDGFDLGDPVVVNTPAGQMAGVYTPDGVITKTRGSAIKIGVNRIIKGWHLCLNR